MNAVESFFREMKTVIEPYRIVLADDHVLFRQGLKRLIDGTAGLKVVGEAGNGLELLELLKQLDPHLAVVDISMPHLRGIDAAHVIEKKHPGVKVLILTMHDDLEYVRQAVSAGAEGFLTKNRLDTELFQAIDTIMQGKVYFPQA